MGFKRGSYFEDQLSYVQVTKREALCVWGGMPCLVGTRGVCCSLVSTYCFDPASILFTYVVDE